MENFNTKRATVLEAEKILGKYFPVLDHGFVSLIDYLGSDDRIAESARVSYGIGTKARNSNENLIRYLLNHNHSSPLEKVKFEFHIGLPIFVMRQLIRHRMTNTNEYSARYSVVPLLYYTPDNKSVKVQSTTNKQGGTNVVSTEYYESYLNQIEEARGVLSENYINLIQDDIARETARIDLPLSTYTYCYWSIDLRNLLNVIIQRSDSHAQWEIQQYSNVFAAICNLVTPIAFQAFLDYKFNATTFTSIEMDALKMYHSLHQSQLRVSEVNLYLKNNRVRERERKEFWDKLEPRTQKDFKLDINSARDASHYQQLALSNAVETPKNEE